MSIKYKATMKDQGTRNNHKTSAEEQGVNERKIRHASNDYRAEHVVCLDKVPGSIPDIFSYKKLILSKH